jgi:hypothetical protein
MFFLEMASPDACVLPVGLPLCHQQQQQENYAHYDTLFLLCITVAPQYADPF